MKLRNGKLGMQQGSVGEIKRFNVTLEPIVHFATIHKNNL